MLPGAGSRGLSSAWMTSRDGNGWTTCDLGHRHWGRYGAAGLLAYADGGPGGTSVLLQRRSHWNHHGGTWGTPGGAMDSHESVVGAAPFAVYAASAETAEAAWVHVAKVGRLALHPGFAAQWPALREALQPLAI